MIRRGDAMAEVSLPSLDWLRKPLQEADPDRLRAMVERVVATLMGAEADALCGAAYGERHAERTHRRNGYRERAALRGDLGGRPGSQPRGHPARHHHPADPEAAL